MVPISKSIWPLILFVYANFYFAAITRFNSSFCFSKIFSRERSSSPPPNFAPPFCALCLIVCDFLPKTWNLRRKAPVKKGFRKVRVCVAMKAPVGLLSGRAVCVSRWKGLRPDKLRRPRQTRNINKNSADYAQSNAERILNHPSPKEGVRL